MLSGVNPLQ